MKGHAEEDKRLKAALKQKDCKLSEQGFAISKTGNALDQFKATMSFSKAVYANSWSHIFTDYYRAHRNRTEEQGRSILKRLHHMRTLKWDREHEEYVSGFPDRDPGGHP